MTSRPSTAAPILAVLAIVLPLLLFGLYVGGYFWLPVGAHYPAIPSQLQGSNHVPPGGLIARLYRHRWQKWIFQPAANTEGWLRGHDVEALVDTQR